MKRRLHLEQRQSHLRLSLNKNRVRLMQWRDPLEGPEGDRPHLVLDQTEPRRAEKKIETGSPLYLGVCMPPPPSPLI